MHWKEKKGHDSQIKVCIKVRKSRTEVKNSHNGTILFFFILRYQRSISCLQVSYNNMLYKKYTLLFMYTNFPLLILQALFTRSQVTTRFHTCWYPSISSQCVFQPAVGCEMILPRMCEKEVWGVREADCSSHFSSPCAWKSWPFKSNPKLRVMHSAECVK